MHQIMNYKARGWEVVVVHSYRQGNKCADWLVNEGIAREMGVHYCNDPQEA